MSKNMTYGEVREIVYRRYDGKCAICGQPILLKDMCISLIVPKSKGGYKDFANMQCTCESCCKMKHNLTNDEFFKRIVLIVRRNVGRIFKACVKGGVSV